MAKVGRKPKYNPERVQKICEALERGETKEMAAKLAGISKGQLYAWIAEKSEFADAVKRAQDAFEDWQLNGILEDAKKSLKTLICGQEYEEVKTEYENDHNGNPRIKKQSRTTKKILPNATAVIFALCNRDPEHWKNRVENDVTGRIETEAKTDVSLASVPDDLLAKVIEAMRGQ